MKITIQVKATRLPNVAGLFKGTSDPFAVVTLLSSDRSAKPAVIGQTEVQKNTLNPDWIKSIDMNYELGEPTNILVKIFDEVRKGDNKSMGSAVFDIGAVLGAKGNTKAKKLKNGGTVFVRIFKDETEGNLRLKMSGDKLSNTEGLFRKSDPFYEFMKKDQGHRGTEWNAVHRSPYIKNNLSPKWPEEVIDLTLLCDDDLDQVIVLSVFDHESSGQHVLMGKIETSVNGLVAAAKSRRSFQIMRKGKNKGTLNIHTAEVFDTKTGNDVPVNGLEGIKKSPTAPLPPPISSSAYGRVPLGPKIAVPPKNSRPTFQDYISGGCEINLGVAIDFTGSNGDPRRPGTLHYLNPDKSPNDYEKAIRAIGGVLAGFDSDKKFPVWGFGAKYGGVLQNCFQCGPKSEVDGVEGIINAYHQTFASGLVMSGPTVITEVMKMAAGQAENAQRQAAAEGKQKYSILLILTDGAVSDVAATLMVSNEISNSPLSVVIVGIGNADFSGMQFLDDNGTGPDVVQFVEFNTHRHSSSSLTKATLEEIPSQLQNYFIRNGIQPNPPVHVEEEEIVVESAEEEIDLTLDFEAGGGASVPSGGAFIPPFVLVSS